MNLKIVEKYPPHKMGFIQALVVVLYCTVVGLFMYNANTLFGNHPDKFIAPVMLLLLLSFSVLFCALVVFYRPYILFFDNKKKEAIDIVVHTAAWLFGFFVIFLVMVLLFK